MKHDSLGYGVKKKYSLLEKNVKCALFVRIYY